MEYSLELEVAEASLLVYVSLWLIELTAVDDGSVGTPSGSRDLGLIPCLGGNVFAGWHTSESRSKIASSGGGLFPGNWAGILSVDFLLVCSLSTDSWKLTLGEMTP